MIDINGIFEELFQELEKMTPSERLKRLNELGFDVEPIEEQVTHKLSANKKLRSTNIRKSKLFYLNGKPHKIKRVVVINKNTVFETRELSKQLVAVGGGSTKPKEYRSSPTTIPNQRFTTFRIYFEDGGCVEKVVRDESGLYKMLLNYVEK